MLIVKSLTVLNGEEDSGQLCDEPAEGAAQPPHTQATGITALLLFNSVILLHKDNDEGDKMSQGFERLQFFSRILDVRNKNQNYRRLS
jgi:hypothetical protein